MFAKMMFFIWISLLIVVMALGFLFIYSVIWGKNDKGASSLILVIPGIVVSIIYLCGLLKNLVTKKIP